MITRMLYRLVLAVGALGLVASLFLRETAAAKVTGTRLRIPAGTRVADLSPPVAPEMSAEERQAFLAGIVPMLGSGFAAEHLAKKLGMTSLMGKRLDTPTVRAKEPGGP